MALGCWYGFDELIGTRALRGKECGLKGVRGGLELREDRTRRLVQEIEEKT